MRWSAFPVGLIAIIAAAACRDQPANVIDLVEQFPAADIHIQDGFIDIGSSEDRRHLVDGWSWNEGSGDESFVWSDGDESTVEFFLAESDPLTIRFRCFPFEWTGSPRQSIDVLLNGELIETRELDHGVVEYSMELPAALLRRGLNRLTFRYGWTRAPTSVTPGSTDWRALAVGWHWLRIGNLPDEPRRPVVAGGGRIRLAPGAAVDYFLEIGAPALIEIASVEMADEESLTARLEIVVEQDRRGERVVEVVTRPSEELEIALNELSPGPVRIGFRLVDATEPATIHGPRISATTIAREASSQSSPPGDTNRARRPNILIYLVDTLRADPLGSYGGEEGLTPAIDALAAEGIVFAAAIAQSSWTKPSVASILTGLNPISHGVNDIHKGLDVEATTLAEVLANAGYRTGAFVTNDHITTDSGFAQGFATFDFSYSDAAELTHKALRWLDETPPGGPFFLYVHAVDPHGPFLPPEEFRRRFASDVPAEWGKAENLRAMRRREIEFDQSMIDGVRRLYHAEVAFTDQHFGELMAGLTERGLAPETLVVFVSDHGEEFFEHGILGHGWNLNRQVLDVPLILRLPEQREARRIEAPVQHADLVPTLLDYLDLQVEVELDGRSLLTPMDGEVRSVGPIVSYMDNEGRRAVSVVRGDWKMIEPLSVGYGGRRELYRLGSEESNLAHQWPVLAGRLAAIGKIELAREREVSMARPVNIDQEDRERLRALGYLH